MADLTQVNTEAPSPEDTTTVNGLPPQKLPLGTPLSQWKPEEVAEALNSGLISEEDADHYVVTQKVTSNFMEMEPEEVAAALEYGVINEDRAQDYIDYHENPLTYQFRDISAGIVAGAAKAGKELMGSAIDLAHFLDSYDPMRPLMRPIQEAVFDKKTMDDMDKIQAADGRDIVETAFGTDQYVERELKTDTTLGQIAEGVSQFGTGVLLTGGASMELTGASRGLAYINETISATRPALAKFLTHTISGTVKGLGADMYAFDPRQEGLMDFMSEFPAARPLVIDYLKTDPNDSIAEARLKKGLEGMLVGVPFDAIMAITGKALRSLKLRLWTSKSFNADGIVEVLEDLAVDTKHIADEHPEALIGTPIKEHLTFEVGERAKLGDSVVRIVEDSGNKGKVKVELKDPETGEKVIQKVRKGDLEVHPDDQKPPTPEADLKAEGEAAAKTPDEGRALTKPVRKLVKRDAAKEAEESLRLLQRDHLDMPPEGLDEEELRHASLNLTKLSGVELARSVKRVLDSDISKAAQAKGGVRTGSDFAKAKAAKFYELTGMDPEAMMKRIQERVLIPLSQAESYIGAVGDLVSSMNREAQRLFDEGVKTMDSSKKVQALALKQQVVALTDYLSYGKTTTGRMLQSFNYDHVARKFDPESWAKAVESGEVNKIEKAANILFKIKSPQAAHRLARKVLGNDRGWMGGLLQYVQATLVWGPKTWATNIVGNSASLIMDTLAHHAGVTGHALFSGEFHRMREILTYWHGLKLGVKQSYGWDGSVWKAFKSGESIIDGATQKIEGASGALRNYNEVKFSWDKGTLFDAYCTSFRLLAAQDEFFKNISYHAKRESLITREVLDNFYGREFKPDSKFFRMGPRSELPAGFVQSAKEIGTAQQHLRENLPDAIHYEALDFARETTFTRPLEGVWKSVSDAVNSPVVTWVGGQPRAHYIGALARAIFMPFFNIAVNLFKYTGQHLPVTGWVGHEFNAAWQRGGTDRAEAVAKTLTGLMPLAYGFMMAQDGKTSGFIAAEDRAAMGNAGIGPYSILDLDKDRTVQWLKAAPASYFMAMGIAMENLYANFSIPQSVDEAWDEFTGLILKPMVDIQLQHPFLQSAMDTMKVLQGQINEKKWAFNQLNKGIPFTTLIDQSRAMFYDEWVGEVYEAMDLLRKKIGGMGLGVDPVLPKMHPVFGYPIKNLSKDISIKEGDFTNALGLYARELSRDPASLALLKYGVGVRQQGDEIEYAGESYKFKNANEYWTYHYYIHETGLREDLNKFVQSPQFHKLERDPETAAKALRQMVSQYHAQAKMRFIKDFAKADIMGAARDRYSRLKGNIPAEPAPTPDKYKWAEELLTR